MARTRIFLCGYYGFGNTGDQVILQGIWHALSGAFGGVELSVTSGGGHLEVPASAVPWRDVKAIRDAVSLADLVIVGGGGLFQDYWGVDRRTLGTPEHHGVTFYSWPLLLAAERGIPSMVWGVGIGPLRSAQGRSLVREALAAASWVSVRDHASSAQLRELGWTAGDVEVIPDAAWAAPVRRCDRDGVLAEMGLDDSHRLVAVAVRRWPEGEVPAARELAEALRQVEATHPLGVVFVPFQLGEGRDDDHAAAEELACGLGGAVPSWVVPRSWEAASRFWLCAAADLTVGMRLHACIGALRGGRRPLGLAYDPKVAALFDELGEGEAAREPGAWTASDLAAAIAARLDQPRPATALRSAWEKGSHAPAAVARRLVQARAERTTSGGLTVDTRRSGMELSRSGLQRRLSGILASHRGAPEVVLFLPSVYWQTEVFQRPNQLALALAHAGCLVFFWEPPTSTQFGPGFHRVERRLYVANVPAETWGLLSDPAVMALPYNREWADSLGRFRLVYDVIDHLDVFPGGSAALSASHAGLLREATLVTAVSQSLLADVKRDRPDAVYLPNAADPAAIRRHLAEAAAELDLASGSERRDGPIVGYFGSFAVWLDYDLLERVLEEIPEAELILVGPDLDGSLAESGLAERERVRYLGSRPYRELHRHFAGVDVAVIPFVTSAVTAAVSPLKLYEYLAIGKPVVSTDLPECRDVPGAWVARSGEEFVELVRRAPGEAGDEATAAARRRFVEENTWARRVETLLDRLAVAPPRPGPARHAEQLARRLSEAAAREEQVDQELGGVRAELAGARASLAQVSAEAQQWADRYAEQQREVGRLAQEGAEQLRRAGLLEGELAALRDQWEAERAQAQRWRQKYDDLVEHFGERQREVDRLSATLAELTSTRWFALASAYWRWVAPRRGRADSSQLDSPTHSASAPLATSSPAPGSGARDRAAAALLTTPRHAGGEAGPAWRDGLEDFVFLPIIDWDFRFQRPQQLATALAGRGHRVYYCRIGFRRRGAPAETKQKAVNVWEVSLRGGDRSVYRDALNPAEVDELVNHFEVLRREQGLGATVLVVQLPFWWPVARELSRRWGVPVIYDCMDYHPGFSTNDEAMLRQEDELIAGADLVAVSSAFLEEQVRERAKRVLRVPNGCDFTHFAQVPWRPPAVPVTVGYYGAIAEWFDSQLVGELARLRPDWRFLLVGSTYTCDTSPFAGHANLTLAGEQPYTDLSRWLERMDVLIIPFRRTPLTEATNPVKFYEIMAAGKPLVAVRLPELEPYRELVAFADTAEQFVARIEDVLAQESEDSAAVRRAFAREQTWEKRVELLRPAVEKSFAAASVVVVTYNNLPLTQACLQSVLARTEWPNHEVIVVDNGSTDGTPDYLRGLATDNARVRVILNPDNRGFAAANNQGLEEARGEYLVLLNNDTVVVRGWLTGLIRHLAAHPEWGIVGPVTNWIGNEAQIPVGYGSLIELPRWAAQHCRNNDGKHFPINVLAMFCLAMRRDTFERVGELDERFGIGMFEDDDYALRVREAGLEVVCVEDVFVHHEGRSSFKRMDEGAYTRLFEENRRKFEEKWGRRWTPHRYRSQG